MNLDLRTVLKGAHIEFRLHEAGLSDIVLEVASGQLIARYCVDEFESVLADFSHVQWTVLRSIGVIEAHDDGATAIEPRLLDRLADAKLKLHIALKLFNVGDVHRLSLPRAPSARHVFRGDVNALARDPIAPVRRIELCDA